MADRLIELREVTKSYGRVFALGGVNLHVDRGEVVGLIGDNGAGKSTLIKILAGVVKPTAGEILIRGEKVHNWNGARSRDAGIETVFQDRALAVQQTIVRNIFMGREIAGGLGFLNIRKEYAEAERLMREIGFTSKVFTPALDRRPALRRRASGRRHRPRHLQQGRPDRPRRADHGAVADRDREGLPLRPRRCAPAAARSSSSATTSTTSTTSPTASSSSTAAESRSRRRKAEIGHGRGADRLHGACRPSQGRHRLRPSAAVLEIRQ